MKLLQPAIAICRPPPTEVHLFLSPSGLLCFSGLCVEQEKMGPVP